MAAITVRSARINRPLDNVTNLRVRVDRSLASAGGPGAGVVVDIPVTAQGISITLPAITLYTTFAAPDIVTRGAQYRAELVDGSGNVVETLPGFDAFMILIPNSCTTWDELDEHNDFLKQTPYQIQDDVPSTLMTDINPELINSQWVCIGAQTDVAHDTIGLYFGKQQLPPGIRFSLCAQEMQVSHDGTTWTRINGGGSGSFTAAADSGPSQTISSGDTLTLAGGSGINSVASATDTITFNLDLAPSQSTGPNALSIIANQVYGRPREFKTVRAVNASGNLVPLTDNVLVIDTSGGNITITLATPAAGEYRDFHFKKQTTDANQVILTPAAGQIDNAASYSFNGVIGTAGESRHVVYDGANWWVL